MIEVSVNITTAIDLNRAGGSYEPGVYYTLEIAGEEKTEHWVGPFPTREDALEDARELLLVNMKGNQE